MQHSLRRRSRRPHIWCSCRLVCRHECVVERTIVFKCVHITILTNSASTNAPLSCGAQFRGVTHSSCHAAVHCAIRWPMKLNLSPQASQPRSADRMAQCTHRTDFFRAVGAGDNDVVPVELAGSWRPPRPPGCSNGALFLWTFFTETPRARPRDPVGRFLPAGEPLRAQENGRTAKKGDPRSHRLVPY